MEMDKWIEYAPLLIVVIAYIYQNNVFVRPEQLERMHRQILDEIENKIRDRYVEVNAYKEFQSHMYSELEKISSSLDDLKSFLMGGK